MTTLTHDHTLDGIVGYEIRQTIVDGERLGAAGPIVGTITGADRYAEALFVAHSIRAEHDQFALIDSVYRCGCTDRDL